MYAWLNIAELYTRAGATYSRLGGQLFQKKGPVKKGPSQPRSQDFAQGGGRHLKRAPSRATKGHSRALKGRHRTNNCVFYNDESAVTRRNLQQTRSQDCVPGRCLKVFFSALCWKRIAPRSGAKILSVMPWICYMHSHQIRPLQHLKYVILMCMSTEIGN